MEKFVNTWTIQRNICCHILAKYWVDLKIINLYLRWSFERFDWTWRRWYVHSWKIFWRWSGYISLVFCHFKGQIMSECIYEIIDFPKYHQRKLIDFCPRWLYRLGTCDLVWLFSRRFNSGEFIRFLIWINFQGYNLSKFFGGILENQWFHEYILISSDF